MHLRALPFLTCLKKKKLEKIGKSQQKIINFKKYIKKKKEDHLFFMYDSFIARSGLDPSISDSLIITGITGFF